jgi:hypothetical protein
VIDSDFGPDLMALLCREVLRERTPALIAEACAWAVGLSDHPHVLRVRGRLVPTGSTIGVRAAQGLHLGGEEDGRLELGDARPGSFQDALNAVAADGVLYAERFDREVVDPFVLATCVQAAERARATRPAEWAELLEDLGEDGADLTEVVRVGEWEAPLRIDAEHLVLAAVGAAPLVEVEAEGLPLSLVRAADRTGGRGAGGRAVPGRGSAAGVRAHPAGAARPGRRTARRPAGRGAAAGGGVAAAGAAPGRGGHRRGGPGDPRRDGRLSPRAGCSGSPSLPRACSCRTWPSRGSAAG